MASSTVENYVKRIFLAQQTTADGLVPVGQLATIMNVVPGTATSMVKALSDSGLAEYAPRTGVRLTRGGEQLALHVLRRHRLLELFLVKALGLDWSEVHTEAEEQQPDVVGDLHVRHRERAERSRQTRQRDRPAPGRESSHRHRPGTVQIRPSLP